MSRETTLVVLAAGIGSRYGRLKQLDALTANGETIIDFSIYDAIEAGFSKIVFVVRKAIQDDFRRVFDEKLGERIKVEYVLQDVDLIPGDYLPTQRERPWGTAHALLMTKNAVRGKNFCVINADDFYGRSAFKVMLKHLEETDQESREFSMVGFKLKNTLSENGSVSRGQCFLSAESNLKKVVERTQIVRKNDRIVYVDGNETETLLDPETIVSMNFWGFTPKIFDNLESDFREFLSTNSDSPKAEFFLPSVVDKMISNNDATVSVLRTDSKWLGLTYKEDKPLATKQIKRLQERGIYPSKLW